VSVGNTVCQLKARRLPSFLPGLCSRLISDAATAIGVLGAWNRQELPPKSLADLGVEA
jgi:hypothetical protein